MGGRLGCAACLPACLLACSAASVLGIDQPGAVCACLSLPLPPAPAPSPSPPLPPPPSLSSLCLTVSGRGAEAQQVVIPCGHEALCRKCAKRIKNCPICRTVVKSIQCTVGVAE